MTVGEKLFAVKFFQHYDMFDAFYNKMLGGNIMVAEMFPIYRSSSETFLGHGSLALLRKLFNEV